MLLLGTGSDVWLSLQAYEQLRQDGVRARVAVEQASTFGWKRYVGRRGAVVGMKTFGRLRR